MVRSEIPVKKDVVDYWDNNMEKPVLVLVHGFGATTKYQWYKQVKWLSEEYRVIMPNLLHFGKTKVGEQRFEVADQVEMVHDFISEMGIKEYILGGVSYGGLISMEIAEKYPEGIKKLVIIDAPVKYMYKEDMDTVTSRFEVESVQELFAPSSEKGLKKLMYLASLKKSAVPASWLTEFYEDLYASNLEDKRQLITTLLAGLEEYQGHTYHNINMPTLLVWGENDPVVPSDRGPLIRDHIGENARFISIKKGAHMPCLAKTKKFNKILKEFLDEK